MKSNSNIWQGLIIIVVAFAVLIFRPFQDCSWYNIFCHASSGLSSAIIYPLFFLLLIIGIWRLVKK